jgi:lipopolysaccharide transport system ATP-binding protein
MQAEPVIRFQNVSKRFAFTPDRPQTIVDSLASFFSRRYDQRRREELIAVRDVSFDVYPGESLGIVGRNGSGKSTILKLMTRILRPNAGRVLVRGRVSALLELGAGFHADLTGRENIHLNAAVLGLSGDDIADCYDDIVAFSELGEFINMPVKHYSSGMYMRLGFSVAVHVKPDVLIVDEILAVGDQAFQRKCINQIYRMKREGTTIVLVSHNLNMVRNLCSHLIWIDGGQVKSRGSADEVAGQYMASTYGDEERQIEPAAKESTQFERWGSREIEITGVRLLDADGEEQQTFETGVPVTVEISYTAYQPVPDPEFGLALFRQDGVYVSRPNSHVSGLQLGEVDGSGLMRYHIRELPLLPAKYQMTVAIYDPRSQMAYDHHEKAYTFSVVTGSGREIHGLVELPATWEWLPGMVIVK